MVRLRVEIRVNPNPNHNHNPDPNPNPNPKPVQSKLKTFFGELFASSRRTPPEFARTPPVFASVRQVFTIVCEKKVGELPANAGGVRRQRSFADYTARKL
jgi:hypothetical protein